MKETPATSIIEEYFDDVEQDTQAKAGKQIFNATEEDVDIKTELNAQEIYYINAMKMYDELLQEYGIGSIFNKFYNTYFRLKISKDRKSRSEFVKVSSQDKSDGVMESIRTAGSVFNK